MQLKYFMGVSISFTLNDMTHYCTAKYFTILQDTPLIVRRRFWIILMFLPPLLPSPLPPLVANLCRNSGGAYVGHEAAQDLQTYACPVYIINTFELWPLLGTGICFHFYVTFAEASHPPAHPLLAITR